MNRSVLGQFTHFLIEYTVPGIPERAPGRKFG